MTDGNALRVGVTGHWHLADLVDVAQEVDVFLDRLDAESLVVVSSLAEGADRLVADRVLARGGRLYVLLFLELDDYMSDFADDASRDEFQRFVALAESVTVSPRQESREAAYEHAGRAVLVGSDVLLALWDGRLGCGRGGTAQLVAEAWAGGKPVEIIDVERVADVLAP